MLCPMDDGFRKSIKLQFTDSIRLLLWNISAIRLTYALDGEHYRLTEQLTHRFVHSFCGNVARGEGNNPDGATEGV